MWHTASARNVYTELGDQWAFSMAFRLKWAYVCSVATNELLTWEKVLDVGL
jgi:hypothetical protein